MPLTDDQWVKDYIAGMQELGIEFSEREKTEIIARNINKMIDAFGGGNDEGIKLDESSQRGES